MSGLNLESNITKNKVTLFLKTHYLFIFLFLSVFFLRLLVLIYGNIPIEEDEAQEGIMAIHFYELKRFYLYIISEPIHGGGAIEAVITALLFWIHGGIYDGAIHTTGFILSCIALISFYASLYLIFEKNIAFISSLLYAIATPLIYWNFRLRGGYIELLCLLPWVVYFEWKIIISERENFKNFFLIGFILGVGLWIMELIIPFIICFFLLFFLVFRKRKIIKPLFFFFIGFFTGFLPNIIYNLTHDLANWKYLLSVPRRNIFSLVNYLLTQKGFWYVILSPVHIILTIFKKPGYLTLIPRFFEPDNEWSFLRQVSLASYIQCFIVTLIITYLIIAGRKKFLTIFKLLLHSKDDFLKNTRTELYLFITILNIIVYFILYIIDPIAYRYLLPVFLWFHLFVAILFFKFFYKNKFLKISSYTFLFLFIFFGLYGHWRTLTKVDGKYTHIDFYFENGIQSFFVETSNNSVKDVISFLNNEGIHYIYCPHLTVFLFRYFSREQIATASLFSRSLSDERYPEIAKEVRKADQFAVVTFKANPLSEWLIHELNRKNVNYRTKMIGEFIIFYPLNRAYF